MPKILCKQIYFQLNKTQLPKTSEKGTVFSLEVSHLTITVSYGYALWLK